MKDLKKLLTYQDLDIRLRKTLDVIDRSEDNKKMDQAKHEFQSAKQRVSDAEKEASVLIGFYTEAEKFYEQNAQKLAELDLVAENCEDEGELSALIDQMEKLRAKIVDLDKKIYDRKSKAEKLIKEYRDANELGRKIKDIHAHAKARLDALKKEKEPEISALEQQLKDLEAGIDQDLIAKYKSITAEGKYPAFVEAYEDGSTFSCRGCGLALSQKNKSDLLDNGSCRCETCRRIIYRKI